MAKRTNRKKQTDDYDNQTIIKVNTNTENTNRRRPSGENKSKATPESTKNPPAKRTNNNTNKKTTPRNTKPKTSNTPINQKTNNRSKENKKPASNKNTKSTNSPVENKSASNAPQSTPNTENNNLSLSPTPDVKIAQTVAILIDGNNIEMSLTTLMKNKSAVINFDTVIPKLLHGRGLSRLIYFREGVSISKKLADRLHTHYFGSVVPCHKSADIPLSIKATQLAEKVDVIIILSGDSDYVELVRHLKNQGVRVEIAAVQMTTASILREEADFFSPITESDAFILK